MGKSKPIAKSARSTAAKTNKRKGKVAAAAAAAATIRGAAGVGGSAAAAEDAHEEAATGAHHGGIWKAATVRLTQEGGGTVLLEAQKGHGTGQGAVAAGAPMRRGVHRAAFRVVTTDACPVCIGVARASVDVAKGQNLVLGDEFWEVNSGGGVCGHGGRFYGWPGQQRYGMGDEVGLQLDMDAGTLEVSKNGVRLGLMVGGDGCKAPSLSEGELCWAVAFWHRGQSVRFTPVAA